MQVVGITRQGEAKCNNIQLRGKMPVQVNNKQRPIGFKFILPNNYPMEAPLVYLDEPVNQMVIDMIDYVDRGNRIMFSYLTEWPNRART